MNQRQFLSELERFLRRVDPTERQEMMYDYKEHIRSAIEHGKSEQQAVSDLGNPRAIARELLAVAYVQRAETSTTLRSVARASFAVIGSGFFNLVVVLVPFIALSALLIALFAASFSLIAVPFGEAAGWSLGVVHAGIFSPLELVFVLILLEGLGWLLMVGTIVVGKGFGKLFVRYLKLNLRIIRGAS